MRKKVLTISIGLFIMVLCSSCATSSSDDDKNTEMINDKSKINSDIKYADMIPDPESIFKTGTITIIVPDGEEAYAFRITNYVDGEYETYVQECKQMGFSDIQYEGANEGGKMFMAYTSNKEYYLEVFLGNDINAIDVSCKKADND